MKTIKEKVMSNIAMSNETDLDWLARNVHEWPTNTPKAILPGDATFKLGAVFYGDCVAFSGELGPEYRRVNKADWLARRAELQSVTEQFKPSIEEANRLAQEFKPFTSIEDNQEQDMTQQHDMKQDNGWFERGELPPVGTVCLYVVSDRLSAEVEITAHAKFGLCFVEVGKSGENYVSKTAELHRFRPIRTERDALIEIISSNLSGTIGQIADAIIAAGFKMEAK